MQRKITAIASWLMKLYHVFVPKKYTKEEDEQLTSAYKAFFKETLDKIDLLDMVSMVLANNTVDENVKYVTVERMIEAIELQVTIRNSYPSRTTFEILSYLRSMQLLEKRLLQIMETFFQLCPCMFNKITYNNGKDTVFTIR